MLLRLCTGKNVLFDAVMPYLSSLRRLTRPLDSVYCFGSHVLFIFSPPCFVLLFWGVRAREQPFTVQVVVHGVKYSAATVSGRVSPRFFFLCVALSGFVLLLL